MLASVNVKRNSSLICQSHEMSRKVKGGLEGVVREAVYLRGGKNRGARCGLRRGRCNLCKTSRLDGHYVLICRKVWWFGIAVGCL